MRQSKKDKTCQIILVYSICRAHNYYLNIVKYLSREFKIGVYLAPAEKRGSESGARKMIKVKQTDDQFLSCLESFGAEILHEGRFSCDLLVFPQMHFHPDFVREVDKRIKRNNTIAIQTFGPGPQILKIFSEIGIKKLFVYDKKLSHVFDKNLPVKEDRSFASDNFEIVEMGSPYKKYPVFSGFEVDYMIAFPTVMFIKNLYHKNKLLENILKLTDQLGPHEKVVLKFHNVYDGGIKIFGNSKYAFLNNRFLILTAKGFRAWSHLFSKINNNFFEKHINISNNIMNSVIEKQSVPFSEITPYFNFGIELFLPMVKKGLITGITTSVWYALHDRIPVYNCDDQPFDAAKMQRGEFYKYFYVAPCGGRPEFDPGNFDKISGSVRKADLIDLIKKEL